MRKLILSSVVIGLSMGIPYAMATPFGTAGCGLGALAFKDKPGKIQILSATLNNLISPQTFAITSGTSNCYEDSSSEQASLFITVNQEALKKDISRGDGEALASLSHILRCSDSERLGRALQKNYQNIFPETDTSAMEVNHAIRMTIQSDGQLTKSCNVIG